MQSFAYGGMLVAAAAVMQVMTTTQTVICYKQTDGKLSHGGIMTARLQRLAYCSVIAMKAAAH
jgi:hypothetical protein